MGSSLLAPLAIVCQILRIVEAQRINLQKAIYRFLVRGVPVCGLGSKTSGFWIACRSSHSRRGRRFDAIEVGIMLILGRLEWGAIGRHLPRDAVLFEVDCDPIALDV